jgi:O-antigen/teichoic acid export membrane protein
MIKPSFLKSSVIYTIGGGLPVMASIVLLPFYTNYLSSLHFLQLSFYISISLFVQIFYNFSLDTYLGIRYSELNSQEPHKAPAFIYQVGQYTWLWGVFWSIIFILSGPYVFSILFKKELGMEFGLWAVLSVLAGFFNSGIRSALQALMYEKKPLFHFAINTLNFLLTIAMGIGGILLWPDSLKGPVWSRFLSTGFCFLLVQIVFFRQKKMFSVWDGFSDMFSFCLPYFLFLIATWLFTQADRYLLQYYLNEQDINAYDVLQKCFMGVEFFQNSISAVLLQAVYTIWSKDGIRTTTETNRYFHVLTAINTLILPLFSLLLPLLYYLFISQTYFNSALDYIGIMSGWYALRPLMIYYMAAFLFSRKIYSMMMVFLISSALQLACIKYLTPIYGIQAALFTGLTVRGIQLALMDFTLRKNRVHYKYNFTKMLVIPVFFIMLNIIHYFVSGKFSILFEIFIELFFGGMIFLLYKNELVTTFSRYKELILAKFKGKSV